MAPGAMVYQVLARGGSHAIVDQVLANIPDYWDLCGGVIRVGMPLLLRGSLCPPSVAVMPCGSEAS